jgi:hypothetical protein
VRAGQGLEHVRWIGGPPDSGKTTVAQLVAERHGLQWYRMDQNELEHIRRADPEQHPLHVALRETLDQGEAGFFETWVRDDPPTLVERAKATWIERLDMICDDLRQRADGGICIAEGPGFFPEAIAPLVNNPRQAIWLVATEAFKRESHARRAKSAWNTMVSDPDRALRHHIERDLIMTRMYRSALETTGLPWIAIDGSEPAERIADRVEAHFGLR